MLTRGLYHSVSTEGKIKAYGLRMKQIADTNVMKTLKEYFSELNDNRQSGKVKHLVSEILVIALCAVCSGVQTVFEIENRHIGQ
ncbi:MAG: transposase family protein [Treponemataceae bacterium]